MKLSKLPKRWILFKVSGRNKVLPTNLEIMTRIETWFTVNSSTPRPMVPPPRYKMAIVTWLAIFVLTKRCENSPSLLFALSKNLHKKQNYCYTNKVQN